MFRILTTTGSSDGATEVPLDKLRAVLASNETTVWVDLSAPASDADLGILRDIFQFHPLAIEDCFETRTQPKVDEYPGYLYVLTHGLLAGSTPESAQVVELDAFIGPRYLVTHHFQPSRSVAAVTEQVLSTGYPLRRGPVHVLHAVLDRQASGVEDVLEQIEDRVEALEDAVFARPENQQVASLLAVKRSVLQLRRWMFKQRDVMLRIGRAEFPQVTGADALLFRDVHDHMSRLAELLENYREMMTSIQEAYLSVVSNRMNEIMKFLTLFTSVLMPLTVISGIYGMNFEHMPELSSAWGYPAVLGAMAVTSASILYYFRRRGLLGRARPAALGESSPEPMRGDEAGPPTSQR